MAQYNDDNYVLKPEVFEKAEAGDTNMQYLLGVCLVEGRGTMCSPKEGVLWLTKAAVAV